MNKKEIQILIDKWMIKTHAVAFYYPKKGFIRFNGHTCKKVSEAIIKMQREVQP